MMSKPLFLSVTLLVAAVLAYWSGSPIRAEFSTFVMITAALWWWRCGFSRKPA